MSPGFITNNSLNRTKAEGQLCCSILFEFHSVTPKQKHREKVVFLCRIIMSNVVQKILMKFCIWDYVVKIVL
jgi:hypothetical protein